MGLELPRGDDRTIMLTLTDGTVFSPSDEVWFTLKRRHSDADEDALLQRYSEDGNITVNVGANTASTVIPAAATASLEGAVRLVYDWQVKTVDGIVTVESGSITVTPDVTRATA